MITLLGESFLMNSLINNKLQTIQYIAVGKGTARPTKKDTKLSKQTLVKQCNSRVDVNTKKLILSAKFEARELLGTSEIGILTADNILITHDIYEPVTDDLIGNDTTTIELEYNLEFTTGTIRSQWQASTAGECILYTYEPNTIISVFEKNTGNGYVRVNELSELLTRNGAYYHDVTSKNLYIRTTLDNTISNIDEMTIIVQNK